MAAFYEQTSLHMATVACRWLSWCCAYDLDAYNASDHQAQRWVSSVTVDGRRPAWATRQTRKSAGLAFYRWLFGADPAAPNPFRGVRLGQREAEPTYRILDPDELAALWEAALEIRNRTCLRDRAILAILLDHGCRPIELHRATRANFRIRRSDGTAVLTTRAKGGNTVAHELTERAARSIAGYLDSRPSVDLPRTVPLFPTIRATSISTDAIHDMVRKMSGRADLADAHEVTPYTLRRTLAEHAKHTPGMSLASMSALFGHRKLSTTEKYVRPERHSVAAPAVAAWRATQVA